MLNASGDASSSTSIAPFALGPVPPAGWLAAALGAPEIAQMPAAPALAVPVPPAVDRLEVFRAEAQQLVLRARSAGFDLAFTLEGKTFGGESSATPDRPECKRSPPRRLSDFPWAADLAETMARFQNGARKGSRSASRHALVLQLFRGCVIERNLVIIDVDLFRAEGQVIGSLFPALRKELPSPVLRAFGRRVQERLSIPSSDGTSGIAQPGFKRKRARSDDGSPATVQLRAGRSPSAEEWEAMGTFASWLHGCEVVSAPTGASRPIGAFTLVTQDIATAEGEPVIWNFPSRPGDLMIVPDAKATVRMKKSDVMQLVPTCGVYSSGLGGRRIDAQVRFDDGEVRTWNELIASHDSRPGPPKLSPSPPTHRVDETSVSWKNAVRVPGYTLTVVPEAADRLASTHLEEAHGGGALYRVRMVMPEDAQGQRRMLEVGAHAASELWKLSRSSPYTIWPGTATTPRVLTFVYAQKEAVVFDFSPGIEAGQGVRFEVRVPNDSEGVHAADGLDFDVIPSHGSVAIPVTFHECGGFKRAPTRVISRRVPMVLPPLEGAADRSRNYADVERLVVDAIGVPVLGRITMDYYLPSEFENCMTQLKWVVGHGNLRTLLPGTAKAVAIGVAAVVTPDDARKRDALLRQELLGERGKSFLQALSVTTDPASDDFKRIVSETLQSIIARLAAHFARMDAVST